MSKSKSKDADEEQAASKPPPIPENRRASPFVFEVTHRTSLLQERARLAQEAEDLTVPELREEAERVGIDTSDAASKAALVEKVRDTARNDTPASTSNPEKV